MSAGGSAEQVPARVGKWRTSTNHVVTRVLPMNRESIPYFCWSTKDHPLGDEVRLPPALGE